MSNSKNITIPENCPRVIVVIEAGWVLLADSMEKTHPWAADLIPESVTLINASTIRVWGTTAGLGEIVANGPTAETILDPCGNPIVPIGKILQILPCTY